ncbi:MAG: fluoride efflux transporter FluC [Acidimicrobiia bacterium]
MRFVWVGVGEAVGSVLRYAIGLTALRSTFPWATLTINISGSFALGLLLTWAMGRLPISIITPVSIGVLGGFTTFSAFAWEGFFLIRSGRAGLAAAYLLLSVIGGLIAAWLGYVTGRALL